MLPNTYTIYVSALAFDQSPGRNLQAVLDSTRKPIQSNFDDLVIGFMEHELDASAASNQ